MFIIILLHKPTAAESSPVFLRVVFLLFSWSLCLWTLHLFCYFLLLGLLCLFLIFVFLGHRLWLKKMLVSTFLCFHLSVLPFFCFDCCLDRVQNLEFFRIWLAKDDNFKGFFKSSNLWLDCRYFGQTMLIYPFTSRISS